MNNIVSSSFFGVLISLIAYEIGILINKKLKFSFFNPLLIAMILLIAFLTEFHIRYSDYNNGGQIISFFLAPATIALALPLYKRFSIFKENAFPILAGILCGSASGILSIIILSRLFSFSDILTKSLIPKSITTPIGMVLSKELGGLPSITVVAIILTGIIGSIIGPSLYKIFKINDKIALGIALGSASHVMGTAKAMEFGEIEGAMGSITIAISGIITVLLAPILWSYF